MDYMTASMSMAQASPPRSSAAQLSRGGYDAIDPKGRRRGPSGINAGEDVILPQRGRDLVASQAKTLHRNYAVARFLIDKHLDYNTQFDCYSSSGDDGFDVEFHHWLKEVTAADKFDTAGRHGRERFLRLLETRRVLDGDCGVMQLTDGSVQAIEADVIRNPTRLPPKSRWVNGVKLGPGNRTLAYSIAERRDWGYGQTREVPANRMYLLGAYDRFEQFRGISSFTSSHDSLQDCYEACDYTRAKMKAESLLVAAIFRDANTSVAPFSEEDATDTAEQSQRKKYQIDFGRGPVLLDLEPGDDAKFLTSNSPGSNVKEFLQFTIMIALKSLGMPYSFFDEAHTNFFGSRAAWLHYERHCEPIRKDNADFLDWWLKWRLQIAVQDKELKLPRKLTLRRPWWEWVAAGMPWWQPEREIGGDRAAVESGFDTPQRICRARGKGDIFKNIDQIALVRNYAEKKGVPLSYAPLPVHVGPNEELVG